PARAPCTGRARHRVRRTRRGAADARSSVVRPQQPTRDLLLEPHSAQGSAPTVPDAHAAPSPKRMLLHTSAVAEGVQVPVAPARHLDEVTGGGFHASGQTMMSPMSRAERIGGAGAESGAVAATAAAQVGPTTPPPLKRKGACRCGRTATNPPTTCV